MFVIQSITLILPILIPGLVMIYVIKHNLLSALSKPIDLDYSFRNKPLLGKNKTFRGFIIYVLGALVVTIMLWYLKLNGAEYVHWLFVFNPIVVGLLYGFSYSFGEIINSFVKRRLDIKPGEHTKKYSKIQYVIDISDGPILVTFVLMTIYGFSWQSIFALFIAILIHGFSDIILFRLSIKKK